ncbi:MAG: polymorphic toxin-type HINT domain-containing protein [Microthrixaceae bacterium]
MANGERKPISEVEAGDMVLAEDPETGERGPREVTHLWVHGDTLVDLEIDGETIATTEDHPFWNHTDGEWQRADALDEGDLVLTSDDEFVAVDGLVAGSAQRGVAYNLTVDGIHTYYVVVGDEQVLVHNVCFDGIAATAHGRQRLAEFGFDDVSIELLRSSPHVYEQAGGGMVHVARRGDDVFDFVVIGDSGVITAHRGMARHELDRLAYNNEWLGYP